MPDIEIIEPRSAAEAVACLAERGEGAKIIAGGTAVVLMLKNRLIAPDCLISLGKVPGLDRISYDEHGGLHLGALVTIRQAEISRIVRARFPVLAQTFGQVANVRVRNAATVGGNMAEADYASDPPCVLQALRAHVVVEGPAGRREIPLTQFFQDFYETALGDDELLTDVVVPSGSANPRQAYLKYVTRSSEDRPCIGACAWIDLDESGLCRELRVTLGAIAATPQEFPEAEALATGSRLTPDLIGSIAEAYAREVDPLSDLRGSAWYRREMAAVFVRRAIGQALATP